MSSQGTLRGTRVEESMTDEQVDNVYIVMRETTSEKHISGHYSSW